MTFLIYALLITVSTVATEEIVMMVELQTDDGRDTARSLTNLIFNVMICFYSLLQGYLAKI